MSKYQSHNYCFLVTTPKPKIVPVKITPRVSTFLTDEDLLRAAKKPITAYMIGVSVRIITGKSHHAYDVHTRLTTLVNAGSITRVSVGNKVLYKAKVFGEK